MPSTTKKLHFISVFTMSYAYSKPTSGSPDRSRKIQTTRTLFPSVGRLWWKWTKVEIVNSFAGHHLRSQNQRKVCHKLWLNWQCSSKEPLQGLCTSQIRSHNKLIFLIASPISNIKLCNLHLVISLAITKRFSTKYVMNAWPIFLELSRFLHFCYTTKRNFKF